MNEQKQAERQAIIEGLQVALHYGKEDEVYVKGIALAIHSRLDLVRKEDIPKREIYEYVGNGPNPHDMSDILNYAPKKEETPSDDLSTQITEFLWKHGVQANAVYFGKEIAKLKTPDLLSSQMYQAGVLEGKKQMQAELTEAFKSLSKNLDIFSKYIETAAAALRPIQNAQSK